MNLGAQWVYSTCQLTYMELIHSPHLPALIVLWLSMPLHLHTGNACPAAGGRGGPGAEHVECLGGY